MGECNVWIGGREWNKVDWNIVVYNCFILLVLDH